MAMDKYIELKEELSKPESERRKMNLIPRIMILEYNGDDWISSLMNTVMIDINKDQETHPYLRFLRVNNVSNDVKEQIIKAADLTPEILERMAKFRNEDDMCSLPQHGRAFSDMPLYKFILKDPSLETIGRKLEMMYYGYDDDAIRLGVFACFDDLLTSNHIFEDMYLRAQDKSE